MKNKELYVAILDYGMGNLFSVEQVCRTIGLKTITTSVPEIVTSASGLIIPGVGAFGNAMDVLESKGLVSAVRDAADAGKPVFGICLGMQILFEKSYEFGEQKGIGLIKGEVNRLPDKIEGESLKVPQIGWHAIYPRTENSFHNWNHSPLMETKAGSYMHFVHSYYVEPEDKEVIASETSYGDFTFCSAISSGNIFACQFHPERSGRGGIDVYENFKKYVHNGTYVL